jgi:hypothetical protein
MTQLCVVPMSVVTTLAELTVAAVAGRDAAGAGVQRGR